MNTRIAQLCLCLILSAITCTTPARAADPADLKTLLDGVAKIDAPGAPGPLCVFGDKAFTIVAGGAKDLRLPVVAGGMMGNGRVVAFGHNGYFGKQSLATADTARLMTSALRWASAKAKPRVGVYRQRELATFVGAQGFTLVPIDGAGWTGKLDGIDVLCLDAGSLSTDQDFTAVARFAEKGGGLIVGQLGWGWLQLHPGKTLADHPGNRLLGAAGIVWADGMVDRTADAGFAADASALKGTHAGEALQLLLAQADGSAKPTKAELAQAVATLTTAVNALPPGDTLLLAKLKRLQADSTRAAIPSPKQPLKMEAGLARVLLAMNLREIRNLPANQVKAHPAAATFPGALPPEAPRVERTIEVDTTIPGWHSTGLYAPAGEIVTVSIPTTTAADGKLGVRIGAHADSLWHLTSWSRCPEICRHWAIKEPSLQVASSFGGLVYIEVPGRSTLGKISVRIAGAAEAPYYVAGQTTLADWKATIRNRPAPWAELATRKVILTLPSQFVRTLEDPEDLMRFWDGVADACSELAGRPLDRERPERYVTDVQISAGYMHSGYPIMTHLDIAPVMVEKAKLVSLGHGGVWGLYHEIGHNHQSPDWTFAGTGEVTVNLFSRFVIHKLCRPDQAPNPMDLKRLKKHLEGGADFEKWKSDPFLALMMYDQLQAAFGWDAFKKVFAEYRDLPANQRPRTDDEKRDQWMVRFSRTVGKNLGPFFQAWGVPTSEKARASIADLPVWMPEGFGAK